MSDKTQTAGRADPVDVNDPAQVRFWTERYGISELDLRAAVGKVGLEADKVQEFLTPDK